MSHNLARARARGGPGGVVDLSTQRAAFTSKALAKLRPYDSVHGFELRFKDASD